MAYDNNSILQALVTKTTDFNSTGLDLKTGTPSRGQTARVLVTSYISAATAGSTFVFKIEASADDTTYVEIARSDNVLTGGTAAAAAELFIPFTTKKRYVRLAMDIGTTSGTPSISYLSDLGLKVQP